MINNKVDKQRRAINAAQVLENPTFKDALDAVKGFYTQQMIETKPEDAARREHLHRCIHALYDVEHALTGFIQSGKIEKAMNLKKEKAKK